MADTAGIDPTLALKRAALRVADAYMKAGFEDATDEDRDYLVAAKEKLIESAIEFARARMYGDNS